LFAAPRVAGGRHRFAAARSSASGDDGSRPLREDHGWQIRLEVRMSSSMLITAEEHVFEGGFPTPQTVPRARDDADLVRAITAYRFF
jgi:hypothetical protein